MTRNNKITVKRLEQGQSVALTALEVREIPSCDVIDFNKSIREIETEYKNYFNNLLFELSQAFQISKKSDANSLASFELLWISEKVENQTYLARIRIFLIVRSISETKNKAVDDAENYCRLAMSVLKMQQYVFNIIDYEALSEATDKIKQDRIISIVKNERVEKLQNPIMPNCYTYDKFPEITTGLDRVVNVLTNYPNNAISVQIIPDVYTSSEIRFIENTYQSLNTLVNGVVDQGIGNISFSLASKHAEIYKYYSENKTSSLFRYNIVVFGETHSASIISTKLSSQIGSVANNTADLRYINLSSRDVNIKNNFYPLPWALNEVIINISRKQQALSNNWENEYYRLPHIITANEATNFFRLPIGMEDISEGIKVDRTGKRTKTYYKDVIDGGDIKFGKLRSSPQNTLGFSYDDLTKHMLVVGMPGSGKTTFNIAVLDQLWKKKRIPFLVIEPAKNEYRAMINSIPDIQVFTPGKEHISPFAFNPFVPPNNVRLGSYKSTIKAAFKAAVTMASPLDKIFEQTVNNCYSDFKWLDSYTNDDGGKIFNISDFILCFERTFSSIGYTGEVKNIGRAGVVRLNTLRNAFDCYNTIPINDLLDKPTIIELAAIEDSEEKSLFISLLLLSIMSYVNSNYIGEGKLKNVILLEEAHVLLDAQEKYGSNEADPTTMAKQLLKRMLAEIRAYGVGIIIADQSPRKVSLDVVSLTDMKVSFRLVEKNDKDIIGDSINLNDNMKNRLGRLKPGEALAFFSKLEEAEEVITEDYRKVNNINITISDLDLLGKVNYWKNKEHLLRPYPECEYVEYCKERCYLKTRELAKEVSRRIFHKHIGEKSEDYKALRLVFENISKMIKKELINEEFCRRLLLCTKVHLFRDIKYKTSIYIPKKNVIESLQRK